MDPVSALGVAAAAVQFVDFSATIVKDIIAAYQFLESGNSSLSYFQRIKTSAHRLHASNLRLRRSLHPDQLQREPTQTENDILAVSQVCIDISIELQRVLDKLNPDNTHSKIKTVWMALKVVWEKGNIDSLEQRLLEQREQLMFVILLSLR